MNSKQKLILLVEDTKNVRNFLEVTLKFKGYRVAAASDGQEAIEHVASERPDLIITDILMPKLDGFALVQKLRTEPETCNIPIIFISASYITPADRDFAYQLGIAHFIEKPIDAENFLLTVAEVLTEDHTGLVKPLSDEDFLEGYRNRLVTKLRYKKTQIVRIDRLLKILPEDQKASFRSMLTEAQNERDLIQDELDKFTQLNQNKAEE